MILDAVQNVEELEKALQLHQAHKGVNLTGLANSAKSVFCAALASSADHKKSIAVFVPTREEMRLWQRELAYLCPDVPMVEFYPRHLPIVHADSQNLELAAGRVAALRFLQGEARGIVFVTAESLLQKQSDVAKTGKPILLGVGDNVDKVVYLERLLTAGYERVEQVDAMGQFAVRGAIVDVFPIGETNPVRIEWFDDRVDGIRSFAVDGQRKIAVLSKVAVPPIVSEETVSDVTVFDLCKNAEIFVDEPAKLMEMLERVAKENLDYQEFVFHPEDIEATLNRKDAFTFSALTHSHLKGYETVTVPMRNAVSYNRNANLIQEDLHTWLQQGKTPVIMMVNTMKAQAFADNLCEQGLSAVYSTDRIEKGKVNLVTGNLEHGFYFWNENWVLLTENDLFGTKKRKSLYAKNQGAQLQYFTDIKAGDYVVHGIHGIGRYDGVETFENNGKHTDYLVIAYAGEDKLYVPVEQVGLLHKYVGNEGSIPRLSKMGGADWQKVKSRAVKAITILAEELLRLYAQRQMVEGHAFSPDTKFQKDFEDGFPFEETPDQLKAIEEIKKDMESPKPMERLLCGDVGYGKTEVALRAAFKAVMDGKQVAVLAPTTVLSQQHYLTFSQRMHGFGPNVALLNRFTTGKEQKKILADLAEGTVDIIIGTHRILQSDVVFHDLGLLIIDEEQRFGVAQKEKIKKWRTGIDVLSLSATPIPRTLHLALVNGRDMSVIETPPENRLPVETFVVEYDENLLKEALERELRRGGQIFYVHNRIEHLAEIELRLHKLVPGMRILTAHGRMPENQLEETMIDFYNGDCDLLLCTTIVENGLDVPKANTIIIDGADHFGLSQLYQMRGRVGRSSRLAYAYLFYRKNQALSEVAEKRLQAVRDFTELGAGFKIAMRDMEIRGAGNILGAEQHGHIAGVGFHEYCTMLEQTIRRLQTGKEMGTVEQQPVLELSVDAYISDDYIDQPRFKLEIYRRLTEMEYAKREEFLEEIIDRFGEPPQEVKTLWRVAGVRSLCRILKIKGIHVHTGEIRITFSHQSPINIDALVALVSRNKNTMKIIQGQEPVLLYKEKGLEDKALDWLEKELPKLV